MVKMPVLYHTRFYCDNLRILPQHLTSEKQDALASRNSDENMTIYSHSDTVYVSDSITAAYFLM